MRAARVCGSALSRPLPWLVAIAAGCAPALPSLSGARTTPEGRADVAVGFAGRVVTSELAEGETSAHVAPGGLAPVALARVGLGGNLDVGLVAAGGAGRIEARVGARAGLARFHAGLAVHGGYAAGPDETEGRQATGWRAGAFVPLTVALNLVGVAEVWLGARLSAERVEGLAGPSEPALDAWGIRAGGVAGLALGFRRVHLLAELAVDGEWWRIEHPAATAERAAVVLTPAVAVRFRL